MTTNPATIMIVAAEASSSLYAQRLLEHWRETNTPYKTFGVGSYEMESLGFEILGRSEDMAVVGVIEVIKHYGLIRRVFKSIVEETKRRKPQLILLMDYPEFNLRLAEKLKPLGIPIVYYISPQVWAWRKSRVHKIKRLVDKMLVLLPFEKPFYKSHNVDVEFVGHPLLDEIGPELLDKKNQQQNRSRYGVSASDIWVGLMPGSRNSELLHNLASQIDAAEKLYAKNPNLKFGLLVAPSLTTAQIEKHLPRYSFPLIVLRDEPMKMVSMMDYVICASGTATLVVGLLQKPMVIMYRMSPITAWIALKVITGVKYFGLVNLILDRKIVNELFQDEASGTNLAGEILRFIDDKDYCDKVRSDLKELAPALGEKGATLRVADTINDLLHKAYG